MKDAVTEILVRSKINVLNEVKAYIDKEIATYEEILAKGEV